MLSSGWSEKRGSLVGLWAIIAENTTMVRRMAPNWERGAVPEVRFRRIVRCGDWAEREGWVFGEGWMRGVCS